MKFIIVKTIHGKLMWINPKYIVSIYEIADGTRIEFTKEIPPLIVTDSPEEIVEWIEEFYEQNLKAS